MKKQITKVLCAGFLFLSIFCLSYVNTFEKQELNSISQFEEISTSTDRMVSSVKSATLVVGKVIDFLTRREMS